MSDCRHPITFDEQRPGPPAGRDVHWWRSCAMCGLSYNRTQRILEFLAARCWDAWRIDFGRVAQAIRDEGDWRHEEFVP